MRRNSYVPNSPRGAAFARRTVAQFGGTARYTELIEAGATDFALRSALREGALIRPHRGTYVIPGTAKDEALAEVFRATVTCVSQCSALGLPLLRDQHRTHLLVPRDRSLSRPSDRPVSDIVLHRRDDVAAEYASSILGAIDFSGVCLPGREQLAIVDYALHEGLMRASAIAGMQVSTAEQRAFLESYCDGRAESMSETFARLGLAQAGIRFEPQRSLIPGTRTDLVVENLIALEVDSKKHHSDWDRQRADRSRDRQLTILGYIPMRITFEDAAYAMDEVIADIEATLWRNGMRKR